MQNVFLDESGIHRQDGKFCVALVCVSVENIELLEQAVVEAGEDLKIGPFHWSHTNWKVRTKFLEKILKHDFSVRAGLFPNPFREIDYQQVLPQMMYDQEIKTFVMDGKKPRLFKRKLKKTLQSLGIVFDKLILGNDKSYPILRVADFCAGIIRTYYEKGKNQEVITCFEKLKSRIELFIFP